MKIKKQEVTEKLRLSLFMALFTVTILISNLFKSSINNVNRVALDTQIREIDKIKIDKLISENKHSRNYLEIQNTQRKTKLYVGDTVKNRIEKTYKMK